MIPGSMQLPFEVLSLVFTYLPQKDLDNAQLVCKLWKEIANDKIWKEQFNNHFGTNEISPVSPYFTLWRRELICRCEVLHRWRKCLKQTDITLNSTLTDNTNIFCSFGTDAVRAVCFNTHRGAGNIIELNRGKIKRKIYASRYSRETLPVSAIDGSRFGMIYGFLDGTVTTVAFSRDGSIATEYKDLPFRHGSAVTSVWIAKSRNFNKPTNRSIGIATGSFDGTVSFNNTYGSKEFCLEKAPVLMLEGSMYGSYAADDGDVLIAYYGNGAVYKFLCTQETIGVTKLATIPLKSRRYDSVAKLHLCNNYVITQFPEGIFVTDTVTSTVLQLDIAEAAEVTAFAIDKSNTPGTKYIAAGLSTNDLCVWSLPSMESPDTTSGEAPKIELMNSKSNAHRESSPSLVTDEAAKSVNSSVEERVLETKPFWSQTNPIGFEHRLVASNKPQITQLALNSVVLLIAGYNGLVMAVDLLSGRVLKRINSRVSKNVLDIPRYSRDGFVPVTHVIIDPDPLRLRCLISTRPAVQFLDLGSVGSPIRKHTERKKSNSKSKHRGANISAMTARHDLEEALELRRDFEASDAEREEADATLAENFGMEGMGDEEQLAYAMMLSQQQEQQHRQVLQEQLDNTLDEDESLRLAIQLSELEASSGDANRPDDQEQLENDTEDLDEDESLRRAIELSLQSN